VFEMLTVTGGERAARRRGPLGSISWPSHGELFWWLDKDDVLVHGLVWRFGSSPVRLRRQPAAARVVQHGKARDWDGYRSARKGSGDGPLYRVRKEKERAVVCRRRETMAALMGEMETAGH
jgi:hypothetical protein